VVKWQLAVSSSTVSNSAPATLSSTSSAAAPPLPSWLLASLLALVATVIVAMFVLTLYNLSAPRSALKNILGRRGKPPPSAVPTEHLIETLGLAVRVGKRTTRTTLAIAGFSLLGLAVVAIFGASGQGTQDLRSQAVAAVTTLVAAISGFYFGSETAGRNKAGTQAQGPTPAPVAPTIDPDPANPTFRVGQSGTYTPVLSGEPAPTVRITGGALPAGLQLDTVSGRITGSPVGAAGEYDFTLTASNGVLPDATLSLKLIVS
jgi:hypothetical protein